MTEFQVIGRHFNNKVEMNLVVKNFQELLRYMNIFYPSVEIQSVSELSVSR